MSRLGYFLGGVLTGAVGLVGAAMLHDHLESKRNRSDSCAEPRQRASEAAPPEPDAHSEKQAEPVEAKEQNNGATLSEDEIATVEVFGTFARKLKELRKKIHGETFYVKVETVAPQTAVDDTATATATV